MAMTKEALTDLPVFDTRKYVRTLTREGSFSEKQANANADGLQEALQGVATKAETHAVKIDLKADIREVRAEVKEVKAEIQALRTEFQAMQEQMKGLRQLMVIGFSVMATMMATLMAVVAVSATLLFGATP